MKWKRYSYRIKHHQVVHRERNWKKLFNNSKELLTCWRSDESTHYCVHLEKEEEKQRKSQMNKIN